MPRISVILPTFNSAAVFGPTVKSVLRQTWTDFELLIIDDGSSDETVAHARRLTDSRVSVHAFPNAGVGGPAVGRNRGIALAKGEFVAFINHDDIWTATKLADQLQALEANPDAGLAYSWLSYVDENNRFLYSTGYPTASGNVLPALATSNILFTGSNPLIRKTVFDAVGGFDSHYRLVSDWEFFVRAAREFSFVNVPSVHVKFKVLPDALTANTKKLESDGTKLLDAMYATFPDTLQRLRPKAYGNFYEYLASRTLQGPASPQKGALALSFLRTAVQKDRSVLWRKSWRVLCVLTKSLTHKYLTPDQYQTGMTLYRRIVAH